MSSPIRKPGFLKNAKLLSNAVFCNFLVPSSRFMGQFVKVRLRRTPNAEPGAERRRMTPNDAERVPNSVVFEYTTRMRSRVVYTTRNFFQKINIFFKNSIFFQKFKFFSKNWQLVKVVPVVSVVPVLLLLIAI